MVWGEGGSNCCSVVAGRHPNDFTYTGVLPFSFYGAQPPPIWLRGESTRQLDCLAAAARLLHLEALFQHSAQAKPNDRVTVDDQALGTLAQDRFRSLGVH